MPDINKCINEDCELKLTCYRYTCAPSKYSQSYVRFEPEINESTGGLQCVFHKPLKNESTRKIQNKNRTTRK